AYLVLGQLHLRLRSLEVETRRHFPARLVDGVAHFLQVDLGNHVESRHGPKRYLGPHGSVPERPKGADCKSAGTAFGGSNPPRPTSLLRQKPLQLHHVEPPAELAAHFALGADELETAAAMQRDRSLVTSDDAGDDRVEAVLAGQLDDRLEQQAPDALALAVASHVDRVLDARRVRRPVAVARQRGEAHDVAVV